MLFLTLQDSVEKAVINLSKEKGIDLIMYRIYYVYLSRTHICSVHAYY